MNGKCHIIGFKKSLFSLTFEPAGAFEPEPRVVPTLAASISVSAFCSRKTQHCSHFLFSSIKNNFLRLRCPRSKTETVLFFLLWRTNRPEDLLTSSPLKRQSMQQNGNYKSFTDLFEIPTPPVHSHVESSYKRSYGP